MKVLADPSVDMVAVEPRDRLMRFGAECVASALAAQGRALWWSIRKRPRMTGCKT